MTMQLLKSPLTDAVPNSRTVYNGTGSPIAAGSPVYISGYDATTKRFSITLADADAGGKMAQFVTLAAIANASTGPIAREALLTGVLDTSGSSVGASVYLSTTAGTFTLTAPSGAAASQQVCGIVTVLSASVGAFLVNMDMSLVPIIIGSAQMQSGVTVGTVTSTSANALTAGPSGTTNPTFNVDASTASAVTGLNVKGAASGAGLALTVISSAGAEALTIDAKSTGTITIGGVSTGNVILGTTGHTLTLNNASGAVTLAAGGLTLTSGGITVTSGNVAISAGTLGVTGATTVTSAGANSLAVGRQGATNPAFNVDSSTATQLTGVQVKGAGTGAGAAISVIEAGGSNNNLTIDAMGSGIINIGGTSTGIIVLGRGANKGMVYSYLKTSVNAQNAAPTMAQWLGGYINHNSQTAGGTLTTPTGANISGGIPGVAVGDSFETLYANTGNQTVTITAGDGNVTFIPATPATVATHKNALLIFVNTGANTWDCWVSSALG